MALRASESYTYYGSTYIWRYTYYGSAYIWRLHLLWLYLHLEPARRKEFDVHKVLGVEVGERRGAPTQKAIQVNCV